MPKHSKKNATPRAPRRSGEEIYEQRVFTGFRPQQPHSSFPDRTLVSLDYWYAGRQNPGAVAYSDTVFSLNSLFDPEVSGVGHQPREFDTWASVYGKYRVLETMVEVYYRQRASHGIAVALVPNNSSTGLTGSDIPLELPRAVNGGVTGSSQPVCRVVARFDPRAVLGMTHEEFRGDDETAALVTASPSQQVYLHVFAAQLDGTTAFDGEFSIRLRYKAEFYDRKVLSPSSLLLALAAAARQTAATAAGAGDAPVIVAPAAPPPPPAVGAGSYTALIRALSRQ